VRPSDGNENKIKTKTGDPRGFLGETRGKSGGSVNFLEYFAKSCPQL
jgi:hypothetical protein